MIPMVARAAPAAIRTAPAAIRTAPAAGRMDPAPARRASALLFLLFVGIGGVACAGGSAGGAGPTAEAGAELGSPDAEGSAALDVRGCADLPERPFRAALDPLEDSRRGTRIRFYNTTGCTLRVTAISLFSCDNVQNECDRELRLDVVIPPGEERNVFTVLSENRNYAWSFKYRYNWARVRG